MKTHGICFLYNFRIIYVNICQESNHFKCFYRTEANSSTSDYAIPLPPPPGLNDFSDVGGDSIDSGTGIEHGPFLPPGTTALNNLFAEAGDSHDDSPMGECM